MQNQPLKLRHGVVASGIHARKERLYLSSVCEQHIVISQVVAVDPRAKSLGFEGALITGTGGA